MDSILKSVRKLSGVDPNDNSFDTDLIIHTNAALMKLNQLGVGPLLGFYIEDESETWDDFEPDKFISRSIQSYVCIKVRLVFDPPASPTVVDALKAAVAEDEWRIVNWVRDNSQI